MGHKTSTAKGSTGTVGYKDIFRQKEYVKVICASIVNRFGDSIDEIAFTWLVYVITGSAAWSAVVFGVNQLPSVFLQPFAGALVEGLPKKKLLVATDLIRGVTTAGTACLYLMGSLNPWILLAFTFLNSSAEAFRLPAGISVVPQLLERKYYEYGTSLHASLCSVVELIGLGASGMIISFFGIGAAIALDGISFFASAAILSRLDFQEHGLIGRRLPFQEYLHTLKGGFAYLRKQPIIRNLCLISVLLDASIVPLNALQSPLIQDVLGQGSMLLGVFSFAITAGMGVGSFAYPFLSKHCSIRTQYVGSGILIGAGMYAYPLGASFREHVAAVYALTAVNSFILGISCSILMAALHVQFMKTVEQEYMARVGSIFNAGASAANPVASFLISSATSFCPVSQIFQLSALFCVILFLALALLKVKLE